MRALAMLDELREARLSRLDRPLAIAAAGSGAVACLALIVVLIRLRGLEDRFDRGVVDGHAVLVSPDLGPALFGVFTPRIVLPRWALALEPHDRRLILEHEQRHADARDPLLLFASTLLVALQPWNVALWAMRARLRLALETDCDQRVLVLHPDVRRYAELLLLVNQKTTMLAPSVAFAERPSSVEHRIRAMLAPRVRRVTGALAFVGAAAIGLLVVAWKLPVPAANATPIPSVTRTSSITGGGPCMDGTRDAMTELDELSRIARQRHPAAMSAAAIDSTIGFVIDETCAVRRDAIIVLRSPHWNQDTLIHAAFPDIQRKPGTPFAVMWNPTRRRADTRPPVLFYVVQPTTAWTSRRAGDACGFGARSDERCSEFGSIAMRRLDSRRVIVAVHAHQVFDARAPFVDHYFLISSLRPLPADLTRRIPFARVTYQNNAIEIENRLTTDPLIVFGPSFEPPQRSKTQLNAPMPPRVTFDSLIGIAHYLQPSLKLEDVDQIRPAATCDGPVGACYMIGGKNIEFPG
jgi:hypothetical protein